MNCPFEVGDLVTLNPKYHANHLSLIFTIIRIEKDHDFQSGYSIFVDKKYPYREWNSSSVYKEGADCHHFILHKKKKQIEFEKQLQDILNENK